VAVAVVVGLLGSGRLPYQIVGGSPLKLRTLIPSGTAAVRTALLAALVLVNPVLVTPVLVTPVLVTPVLVTPVLGNVSSVVVFGTVVVIWRVVLGRVVVVGTVAMVGTAVVVAADVVAGGAVIAVVVVRGLRLPASLPVKPWLAPWPEGRSVARAAGVEPISSAAGSGGGLTTARRTTAVTPQSPTELTAAVRPAPDRERRVAWARPVRNGCSISL
jgi:hypothetical protein